VIQGKEFFQSFQLAVSKGRSVSEIPAYKNFSAEGVVRREVLSPQVDEAHWQKLSFSCG